MQSSLFDEPGFEIGDVETFCLKHELFQIVGVDEAGRGPLAGPVYAAAVLLDVTNLDDEFVALLDDSKRLSEKARNDAFDAVKEHALGWAIASRDSEIIDEINILQASLRSMEAAIAEVCDALETPPSRVFVDGNQQIETELDQHCLVKGDGRSYAIAAASILAKVARDAEMLAHHKVWPEYGFDTNKGYGSRKHRDAIVTYGPTRIHRLTFGGVREHADRMRD